MKRSLTLLLASLLIVFGMTACGGSDDRNDQDHQNSAVVGDDTVDKHDGTADSGADSGKDTQNGAGKDDSLLDDVEQGAQDAVRDTEDALDDLTADARMRGALVHDRDGDLTDLENGVARNAVR